jgi:hypothetical protein
MGVTFNIWPKPWKFVVHPLDGPPRNLWLFAVFKKKKKKKKNESFPWNIFTYLRGAQLDQNFLPKTLSNLFFFTLRSFQLLHE